MVHAKSYLLQCCLQLGHTGNNLNAHIQESGWINCGTSTPCIAIQKGLRAPRIDMRGLQMLSEISKQKNSINVTSAVRKKKEQENILIAAYLRGKTEG